MRAISPERATGESASSRATTYGWIKYRPLYVGVGVSSISQVGDCYAQNVKTLPRHAALVDGAVLPIEQGCRLSEDDLDLLLPGSAPEEAFDVWHAAGARLVVLTRGAGGALASLDGERVAVPAVATRVVDTVGAGDSFTAGLLHHLGARGLLGGRLTDLRLDEVAEACRFAARVAALTCAVAGPNPPWRDQVAPLAAADHA